MKSDQTIIRKNLMEQLNFITNLLEIKDKNIIILDYKDSGTHKEILAKLDRYTFRAGRNLPDKEFRYLRTVIVTAAVYWGLSSKLRLRLLFPLTFQHRAGVSSYTSSFDLAETCVFGKQSLGPLLCDLSLLFAFAYTF